MLVQHFRPKTDVGKNAACVLFGEGNTVDGILAAMTFQNAYIMPQKCNNQLLRLTHVCPEFNMPLPQHQKSQKDTIAIASTTATAAKPKQQPKPQFQICIEQFGLRKEKGREGLAKQQSTRWQEKD
eukprot:1364247-Ditylum_brightwellii.AAC.1